MCLCLCECAYVTIGYFKDFLFYEYFYSPVYHNGLMCSIRKLNDKDVNTINKITTMCPPYAGYQCTACRRNCFLSRYKYMWYCKDHFDDVMAIYEKEQIRIKQEEERKRQEEERKRRKQKSVDFKNSYSWEIQKRMCQYTISGKTKEEVVSYETSYLMEQEFLEQEEKGICKKILEEYLFYLVT